MCEWIILWVECVRFISVSNRIESNLYVLRIYVCTQWLSCNQMRYQVIKQIIAIRWIRQFLFNKIHILAIYHSDMHTLTQWWVAEILIHFCWFSLSAKSIPVCMPYSTQHSQHTHVRFNTANTESNLFTIDFGDRPSVILYSLTHSLTHYHSLAIAHSFTHIPLELCVRWVFFRIAPKCFVLYILTTKTAMTTHNTTSYT